MDKYNLFFRNIGMLFFVYVAISVVAGLVLWALEDESQEARKAASGAAGCMIWAVLAAATVLIFAFAPPLP